MSKKILIVFFISAFSVAFLSGNAFSAWTQAKGHSYNQLTFSYYDTTEKFTTIEHDDEGAILDIYGDVHKEEQEAFVSKKITYYGEYGITDKLTVFTSIPYDWQKSNDALKFAGERGPSGVGDINIGLRHSLAGNLFGTGMLMSVQGQVKIPEAYDYGNPLTHLSLGNGQYDATLALLFGKGFNKGYGWANIGYNFRFENDEFDPMTFDPGDEVKISFGGGYPITSRLSIRGIVAWTKSVGNASVSEELIRENYKYGGFAAHGDVVLIKDTLSIEADSLSAGVSLAFNITPQIQTVLSYDRTLGPFGAKDTALGNTYGIALVYMH
ncbi:MAG: hypothetical protein AB1306_04435 [Nitrospirota bacterium]